MPGKRSRAQTIASTRSLRAESHFDRYIVTAWSLMLAVALVGGAAAYAGIRGIVSSTTTAAEAARIAPVEGEAAAARVVNPAATTLAALAVFLLAAAARADSPRKYPIDTGRDSYAE
jgi:hypothetical protein